VSRKWIQRRRLHSAFYIHEITFLRTNIQTNNVHNFGSRRLPVLRNVGCMSLQDQIFSTRALYLVSPPSDEMHCAVRCQQLVIWSRDVIRLFSSRRRRAGKASMMTLCTFQQQHLQLHVARSRYLLTNPYILQVSRSWFRASSMIILNKNQPDAHQF
jgi:hypothetical protein